MVWYVLPFRFAVRSVSIFPIEFLVLFSFCQFVWSVGSFHSVALIGLSRFVLLDGYI